MIKLVGSTTATATFATSNETFSVPQTPLVSLSRVEDIEEKSPKMKESISEESYYCCKYTYSGIFGEMLCLMCECSSLVLYERYEKKQGLSSLLYLKCCSTSSCRYIREFFNSAEVNRDF